MLRHLLRSIPHRSIPSRRIPHKILPLKSAPMIVPAIVALSMLLQASGGNIFIKTNPTIPQETWAYLDYLYQKQTERPTEGPGSPGYPLELLIPTEPFPEGQTPGEQLRPPQVIPY